MFLYDLAEAGISLAYVSKEFRHTHLELSFANVEIKKTLNSVPSLSGNLRVPL